MPKESDALSVMARHLIAGNELQFSGCVLDWYRNGFRCDQVPMPLDKHPTHLAIKASIVERLVEVLNAPPHCDNQTVPAWCSQIGAIEPSLRLQSYRLLEDEQYCEAFSKRNLLVVKNFMYFV